MKNLIQAVFIMGLFSIFNLNADNDNLSYGNLTAKNSFEMMKDATRELVVIDVRTEGEYLEDHIKGSILIPVQELASRINELEQYKNIEKIVYCRSGNRSVTASKILAAHGHVSVYNMLGGIKAWRKAGYPTEK